jgi:hypothetical protein
MSNQVDYKGWVWGEEAEAYLDKFDQVQRLTGRIRFVSGRIGQVAELLRCNPPKAFASIRNDWPTREQLREMIKEWEDAKAQLPNYWNRLSEDIRRAIESKHPETATDIRMRIPDDY